MNGSSKSKLFLMEFIFVVLMFALCASICVGIFSKADYISRLATATNESILIAETAVEQIKAIDESDKSKLKSKIEGIEGALNEKHESNYQIKIDYELEDDFIIGKCSIQSPIFGTICEIPLAKYVTEV